MNVPIELFTFFAEAPLTEAKAVNRYIELMIENREARISSRELGKRAPAVRAIAATTKRSQNSITTLSATILRAVGEPLTAAQLRTELKTRHNKDVSSADAVRASLYKLASKGRIFKQDGSRFGLVEWETAPAPTGDPPAGTDP